MSQHGPGIRPELRDPEAPSPANSASLLWSDARLLGFGPMDTTHEEFYAVALTLLTPVRRLGCCRRSTHSRPMLASIASKRTAGCEARSFRHATAISSSTPPCCSPCRRCASTSRAARPAWDRHLTNAELDCAAVAAALKLSPRYINQLLEAEGTSLSRYIWRQRLDRAASDLRNPAWSRRSISVIAMSHGFNDLSHFSKAFRQAFGTSPRDYRAAAL